MVDLLGDDGLLDIRRTRRTDPTQLVEDLRRDRDEMPASNDALREWAASPGKVHTACHLCGSKPRMQCQACSRPACGKDSWVMLGLCRTCATEERMRLWHDRNRTVSDNWLGP